MRLHHILCALLLAAATAAPAVPPIESLLVLNELQGSKDSVGTSFDITGQVLLICDGQPRRINLIKGNDTATLNFWDVCNCTTNCSSGDIVRAQGIIRDAIDIAQRDIPAPVCACLTNLSVLGRSPLPPTVGASAGQINANELRQRFIHARGVIASVVRDAANVGWNWIVLRSDSDVWKIRASVTEHDYPYDKLLKLLDAEVEIRGISHQFASWRKFLGYHMILYGQDGIRVLVPAPDPFTAPDLSSTPVPQSTSHRQKTRGHVLGSDGKRLFLKDAAGRFIPVTPIAGQQLPPVGTAVTVAGFVDLGPMNIQMNGAVIKADDVPPIQTPEAEFIEAERMFSSADGTDIADSALYGKVLRIRGQIANSTDGIRIDGKILLECGKRTIDVSVAHLLDALDADIEKGCLISATGICLSEFDTDVTNLAFPEFKGFVLIPRSDADLTILRRPPWWTPTKLAVVIVLLLATLVAILIWNRMLQMLSERRGRALAREEIASARANLKVEERTRLAVELHDSISQTLTGVSLQIETDADICEQRPSMARQLLGTARQLLASCRQELRCCIWDLRSRTFEEKDLTEAILRMLKQHASGVKLLVRFNVPRQILSETTVNAVLRIIRELVINAVRHGKATQIRIAGEHHGRRISFSVTDDGSGFDTANIPGPSAGHFGIQGIRERLTPFNGELVLKANPNGGTRATVTMDDLSPDTEGTAQA